METFASLVVIMLVAVLAPYAASLVPGRAVPEVVFLVFAGAVLGPHALGVIDNAGEPIRVISDLGLGFLFLMAGYEIDPRDLVSRTGLHATLCWATSMALGLLVVSTLLASRFSGLAGTAFAILLTTTAYGTLAPIMHDRGLFETRVGHVVTVYGSLGELLPILAMSLLLSTRTTLQATVYVLLFVGACVAILLLPVAFPRMTGRIARFLRENAWSGSQPLLRAAVFLMILLVFLAQRLGLDAVLGAFAAGFVLRAFVPADPELESKLRGIGNGFLVPAFFVISGAGIDLSAVASDVGLLVLFIALLVLVRGVVMAVSLHVNPETRDLSWQETFAASAYCTMALPVVVAVTGVAVDLGAMDAATASVLVMAGAVTVLLIPVVTSFVRVTAEAHPVDAVREVAAGESAGTVVRRHRRDWKAREGDWRRRRARGSRSADALSSADYLAMFHGKTAGGAESPSLDATEDQGGRARPR